MKKYILPALATAMLLTSCGGGEAEGNDDKKEKTNKGEQAETTAVESTMVLDAELDLMSLEIPVNMSVPAGTEIVEETYSTYIQNGESFNIEVIEDTDNMYSLEERRAEWDANDVNVVQEYIVDEENGFVAQTEVMGQTEYHFFYILPGEGANYVFENAKGRSFSKAEAMLMYEAVKSAEVVYTVDESAE